MKVDLQRFCYYKNSRWYSAASASRATQEISVRIKGPGGRVLLLPLLLLLPTLLSAQSVAGDWQGTRHAGPRARRIVMHLDAADGGRLAASVRFVDGEDFESAYRADTVLLDRSHLVVAWPGTARFEGTVAPGGDVIRGTWSENGGSEAIELTRATASTAWRDPAAHERLPVNVEPGVALEVLDWGGSGPPVVFLAGRGNTAHVFDRFAPKLAPGYHVYGITRRGFGRSSAPAWGYVADSLADDVLAVIDSLHLRRPVVIGHSLAGEELSSIGSRHPEKVAGLVYLDAAYGYAFFDSTQTSAGLLVSHVRRQLARLDGNAAGLSLREQGDVISELLATSLPLLERDLRALRQSIAGQRDPSAVVPVPAADPVLRALDSGHQPYTSVRAPVLAIFALPREVPPALARDSAALARFDSVAVARGSIQIAAVRRAAPSARVVSVPHANHFVFRSNEADVLRELRAFLSDVAGGPPGAGAPGNDQR
jgi:pimeloyl-ACP methyl ester carboxylesterase